MKRARNTHTHNTLFLTAGQSGKVARIRGWGEGGGLGYLGNTRFYSVDVGCHP